MMMPPFESLLGGTSSLLDDDGDDEDFEIEQCIIAAGSLQQRQVCMGKETATLLKSS